MLRKHSRVVDKFDKRLWTLLDDMADTMYEADGAGWRRCRWACSSAAWSSTWAKG